MFKVQANSLEEYFDADPARKADLEAMDGLITDRHKGALGELRAGRGNFSFITFAQLNSGGVKALLKDVDSTLRDDPLGALEYSDYRIVSSSVAAR
jgi:hypothetical protein